MPNKFHVKIGEIEISLEGDAEYIEKERTIFFGNVLPQAVEAMTRTRIIQSPELISDVSSDTLMLGTTEASISSLPPISINEFLNSKRFNSQIEIALGLIYYGEKYSKNPDFSSDNLKEYFQDAKEKVPVNVSDIILKLSQKAYIQPSANKDASPKRYTLTRTGIEFIEQYVPKEKKDVKTVAKTRKSKERVPSTYSDLTREELHLDKYPLVKSFKEFKEKMMLALYIVTSEGKGEYFTTMDVLVILTDIFGEKVTANQINGVFNRETTWFNEIADSTNKRIVRRKLLNDAIDFAKSLLQVELKK